MHETLYALSEAFSTRRNKSVLSNQVPFEFRRPVGSRWDFLEPVRCQGGRWTWERPNQIPHSDQSRSRFCCMIDSRAFYWPTPHPTHPPMSRAFPTDPYNTPSPTTTQPEVCLIPNSLTSIPLRAFCTSPLKNGLKVKWVKADLKKKKKNFNGRCYNKLFFTASIILFQSVYAWVCMMCCMAWWEM